MRIRVNKLLDGRDVGVVGGVIRDKDRNGEFSRRPNNVLDASEEVIGALVSGNTDAKDRVRNQWSSLSTPAGAGSVLPAR